ncbi:Uu.00g089620.m01.CDS01 [Anthostomella pinea]|uniref:Cation-transporting ATPase n=1 Tax=Anthostomella pinea TaxID=933095 RepID=A0AAI8VMN9_9PEZI|nr:Uu.00g089620.m01.CDS01 [Anthostomella pinea]
MDENEDRPVAYSRRNGAPTLYRLSSAQSSSSVFEDVEMAQDELFSGPVAESLPTSMSAFFHRRQRADSNASFAYYNEEENEPELPFLYNRDGSVSFDIDEMPFDLEDDEEQTSSGTELENGITYNDYPLNRRSSTLSRTSVHAGLLRTDSGRTDASGRGHGRISQKLHMVNEDLTIVIAGFRTSTMGYIAYVFLCAATFGLAYLLLRWLPRWQVRLIGEPCPLRESQWVVLENQWGEMAVLDVKSQPYDRPMSTVFGAPEKMFAQWLEDDADPIMNELRVLTYRYVRFFFHPLKDKFVICNGWKDPTWTRVRPLRAGIDGDEKDQREHVFGSNIIDIEQKSILQLLVDEVFHPFYVFQIASLVLWSLDQYFYYAICIFVMSAGSIIATLVETRATMRRLREISRFECDVRVLRNGFWAHVSSSDLVPGDVYEVSDPNLTQFPSDSLLLSGDCIVNESMLTGESVPVSKIPATDETLEIMNLSGSTVSPDAARHFLFCGTKIVRARRPQENTDEEAVALAMVVRTGFNTTKGSLVRSMLFPKPSGFKFYRDSFRYISVMGCVALLGFIVSFVNFLRLGLAWHLIVVRALDLITIVVPPALPATLTIGTNFALSRLKKKQIFCISPQRVNVGGKLDLMCFDKTGTLTEEGLDILGVRLASRTSKRFEEVVSKASALVPHSELASTTADKYDSSRAALFTMATCHSLRCVDGELVGDPLDVKMFEFTGWTFEEGNQGGGEQEEDEQGGLSPSVARPPPLPLYDTDEYGSAQGQNVPVELGVLRTFEFVSQLRRASVIVRAFGQQSGYIYVKGAPECMREICRPDSFPDDYDELLSYYTHKGYRVIACASKHMKKLSWVKSQKIKRDEVEADLDFVGFIIFENKLKPTTAAVLKELTQSNIGSVMVTGDNILTAISVARNCGLVERDAHCFVPHFAEGDFRDPNARLHWESIDDTAYQLDYRTLLPLPAPVERDASLPYDITNLKNYSLAVSGDVFRWMIDFAPNEVMQRMLVRGKVFARMSPDEKHELVEKFQSIGYCCGFCGDGANDCGALKAADVGISLSEAEASVAAPFTSRVFDIRCVPDVIREGRAALVTSFSCFKFMSLYSAIQFTSVSFLYASASNLGDFQFLFIDVLLILPLAIFMGWSGPSPVLSKKRPTADLVSRKVLTPLLGQMSICILIQAAAWIIVRKQDWYIPPHVNPEKSNIKNSENTALFLMSCFEYIFIAVVMSAGRPFRQPMSQNWPFMGTILAALVLTAYMVFTPARGVRKLMQLTRISTSYKTTLLVLGVVYLVVAWTAENYVFQRLARGVGRAKLALSKKAKVRKEYKVIAERMQS